MTELLRALGAGAAGMLAAGVASVGALTRPQSRVVRTETYEVPGASRAHAETFARSRVFFAHKSVGANVLDGLPRVFQATGVMMPPVTLWEEAMTVSGAGVVHTPIGSNGDPLGKIEEFDRLVRGSLGHQVDVAVLKLCYVDLKHGADVEGVFATYRDTMAALRRDHPEIVFVLATSPLTTERGPRGRARARLGRGDALGPEHNVVREQFNMLVRAECHGTTPLFDIAAIQSTARDGSRKALTFRGQPLFAMEPFVASDPGHLGADGRAILASAFVATIADAARLHHGTS